MLINYQTATANLAILHAHQNLEGIGIAPDGVTLVSGHRSPDRQRALAGVINRTFEFAAQYEAQWLHPLCVKVPAQDRKLDCYSAGFVLKHLQPPELVVLQPRVLADQVERHDLISVNCRGKILEVDCKVLAQGGCYFANLLGPHFREARTLKEGRPLEISIDCQLEIFEIAVNFFEGGNLPLPDEKIMELLILADLLAHDPLQEALIQQLVSADNLYKKFWNSLFKKQPDIFNAVVLAMPKAKARAMLARFKIPPFASTSAQLRIQRNPNLQRLMIELINRKYVAFSELCCGKKVLDLFSPELWQEIRILDLKEEFDNELVEALVLKCPNLRELVLPVTVSGSLLDCLAHLPELTHLALNSINSIDPNCLNNLKHVPKLQYLNIRGCDLLDPKCLDNLVLGDSVKYPLCDNEKYPP